MRRTRMIFTSSTRGNRLGVSTFEGGLGLLTVSSGWSKASPAERQAEAEFIYNRFIDKRKDYDVQLDVKYENVKKMFDDPKWNNGANVDVLNDQAKRLGDTQTILTNAAAEISDMLVSTFLKTAELFSAFEAKYSGLGWDYEVSCQPIDARIDKFHKELSAAVTANDEYIMFGQPDPAVNNVRTLVNAYLADLPKLLATATARLEPLKAEQSAQANASQKAAEDERLRLAEEERKAAVAAAERSAEEARQKAESDRLAREAEANKATELKRIIIPVSAAPAATPASTPITPAPMQAVISPVPATQPLPVGVPNRLVGDKQYRDAVADTPVDNKKIALIAVPLVIAVLLFTRR